MLEEVQIGQRPSSLLSMLTSGRESNHVESTKRVFFSLLVTVECGRVFVSGKIKVFNVFLFLFNFYFIFLIILMTWNLLNFINKNG